MEKLVNGLKSLKNEGRGDDTASSDPAAEAAEAVCVADEKPPSWKPETVFRTCVSSLEDSKTFGSMMAAEADRRGFYTAAKQAFLGDDTRLETWIRTRPISPFSPRCHAPPTKISA